MALLTRNEELPAIAEQQPQALEKLAVGPYAQKNLESKAAAMARGVQPKTLASLVRWARWAARQETPVRLHTTEIGEGGVPKMTGQMQTYLAASESLVVACATDQDGFYLRPFACSLLQFHGRHEDTDGAAMAHFCYAIAMSDESVWDTAERMGIKPPWVVRPAAELALARLWSMYSSTRHMR